MFERLRAVQNAGEGIIIRRGNRIEFVVMASGATDRLPEKRTAHRVDLLVDHIQLQLLLILLFQIGVSDGEKRGPDQLPSFLDDGLGRHQIARDLLLHEMIEWPILIETLDDVISVSPSILQHKSTQRERFPEAGDIQPMPAKPFTKLR